MNSQREFAATQNVYTPGHRQFPSVQVSGAMDGTINFSDLAAGVTLWVPPFALTGARQVMFVFSHSGGSGPTVRVPMEKGRPISGFIDPDRLGQFRPGDRVGAWGLVLTGVNWVQLEGTDYILSDQ